MDRPSLDLSLASALDAVGDAIEITDMDARILYVNRAFTTITGFSREEAIGRSPGELLRSSRHDQEFFDDMWDRLQRGEVVRGKMWGRRKDGSEYPQSVTIAPVADAAGVNRWLVAVKRDISERAEMLRTLEQSEQQFRGTVNAAGDAILISDSESARYVAANEAALRMFGYTMEELRQLTGRRLSPPSERAKVDRLSARLVEHGRARQRRLRMLRADGSTFIGNLSVVRFDAGDEPRQVTVLRDVTDAVQREAELAESEARYRAIFERSGQAMLVIGPSGDVEQVNERALELLARSRSALEGAAFSTLWEEPPPIDGVDSWTGILIPRRTDGVRAFLSATINRVRLAAGPAELLVSFHDVTDLMELHEMRDGFVEMMSEQVQDPLHGLESALGMLTDGAAGDLPAGARELARVAKRDSQRLRALADEMVDLNRVERGAAELNRARFELGTFLENFADYPTARDYEATIVVELATDEAWVDADIERLTQVVQTFLFFALRGSPSGGTVTARLESAHEGARISVAGQGPPLPPEALPSLFARFGHRVRGPSAGMELHIARLIVARLGGDIGYDPAANAFWVWLPVVEP